MPALVVQGSPKITQTHINMCQNRQTKTVYRLPSPGHHHLSRPQIKSHEHIHTKKNAYKYTCARTHAHTRTHAHARKHTHTHAHAHTHTHTQTFTCVWDSCVDLIYLCKSLLIFVELLHVRERSLSQMCRSLHV